MRSLTFWLAGEGKPPMGVFLRVVDLLIEHSEKARLRLTSGEVVEFPETPAKR